MAILFRILFTLGLLILHVSVSSAQVQVNTNGPETPLKFFSENPSYLLASTAIKTPPIYLNCHVSLNIDPELESELRRPHFYVDPDKTDVDPEDEEEDPESANFDKQAIVEAYQKQFKTQQTFLKDHQKNKTATVDSPLIPLLKQQTKRRSKRSTHEVLSTEWFCDGKKIIATNKTEKKPINVNGFVVYPNGTLRFQGSNATAGEYRCKVKFTAYDDNKPKFSIGPILSQSTIVEVAYLINTPNEKKTQTVVEDEALVVHCPISSVPKANYTWYAGKDEIDFDQRNARFFLLTNGSLLIVNSQTVDTGTYRCNATNQFTKKIFRTFQTEVAVQSRPDNHHNDGGGLLPTLQSSEQKIKSGQNLVLHCASHLNKILWTFTPRTSNIPISLTDFNNELKYVNVSVTKHDGIYNCSTESDFQLFDVTVVMPPVFLKPVNSMNTVVPSNVKFNCSVSGNPPPVVEWYKNGKKVPNNHVKYFEYPIIKIESIDPEDEGLYQCLARNDFGEVSTNFYLHVRPKRMMQGNGPENAKCYPMDKNTIYVTFDKEDSSNKIQYFIATDTPRDFLSQISIDATSTSFKIDSKKANLIRPLKPFYLYMRNMQPLGNNMIMSALSKPVICATQGIEPRFVKPPHGIFLRWDAPDTGMNITSYTIQFRNSTSDALTFTNEVIGTYETFPTYVSYDEVEKKLEKIPANNTIRSEWSEVQVPGNVTGLLIINTETIDVRILGTVSEDGELFKQDLQYLPWTEIKSSDFSLDPLRLGEVNSRGVEIQWSGLEKSECAEVCFQLKQEIIARGPPAGIHCMDMSTSSEITKLSAKSFYLKNLKAASNYDVFIRDCKKNVISTHINFQTKRDVPGPVTKSRIITNNGIVLSWEPPHNPNGEIYYYALEWTLRNETHTANVTGQSFEFPNTTDNDRFNIVVKAFGVAGLGYPLKINPDQWSILPTNAFGSAEHHESNVYFDSFMIFAIIFISLVLLVLVVGYILCRRHRYCKNSNGIINSEQSSFPPTTSPLTENIRSDEMYEMQTLIPANQLVMANGKDGTIRPEHPTNGGISLTENQKILRTSTPTDESVDQMCIELPPIKCDEGLVIEIDKPKPANGFLEKLGIKQPSTEAKDVKNGSAKVNGNVSPYKCFHSPENDRNSSSGSSSFDSHRQLIETNLCNGLNNNTVNDRNKIGKSSSIETDNEEEDSEENLHEYDLNDSNLSSKPLHPMSWDFRRPLVGPNG